MCTQQWYVNEQSTNLESCSIWVSKHNRNSCASNWSPRLYPGTTPVTTVHTHDHFTALCPGLPGWTGTRSNIHPLTPLLFINHPYQLPSSTTNHSIIPAQSTYLAISLHNHVLFGLPLGLEPTTSCSMHFFTQSLSSFRNTCPYHRSLFCCSSDVMSTMTSLSLNSLFETFFQLNTTHPPDHSHLCPLKCHLIFFSDRAGLTPM